MSKYLNFLPEIVLFTSALWLLIGGSFYKKASYYKVNLACINILIATFIIIYFIDNDTVLQSVKILHINHNTQIVKMIIVLGCLMTIKFTSANLKLQNLAFFEYPILILFAALSMMLMVSANDLIIAFLSLEMLSIISYIIIAMDKTKLKASDAALKYFILSAVSTAFFLFATSYLYGFTGSTNFTIIGSALAHMDTFPTHNLIAMIMILIAFFFKLSLAPLHIWLADIYRGSNTTVTLFLATIPKLASFILLERILSKMFVSYEKFWLISIVVVALLSMFVGAIGGLWQTEIKRLLAYSTINHMGFVLLCFLGYADSREYNIIIYFSVYIITNIGVFLVILGLKYSLNNFNNIIDFTNLGYKNTFMSICLAILLLSLVGIPPFAGFFTKLMILKSIIYKKYYIIAIMAVIANVISAAYYIKIIQFMYFSKMEINIPDNADRTVANIPFAIKLGITISTMTIVLFPIILGLFIY